MIKIKNIDHVVIRARNPEIMIRFYCDVLGCRLEKSSEKIGLYQLRAGASLIDIVSVHGELGRQGGRAPSEEGRNMHHFCLRIDPFDEQEIKRYLVEKSVSYSDIETHYGAEGYGPSLYIEDPENNVIELKGAANINL
ncbi:VOC family protein [Methylomicrobium sp. wino1]|uniref:VOC family protein n=1 Tax=Methylotuvimicrobium sp. TaxID=2822413 RepID=UPI000F64801D